MPASSESTEWTHTTGPNTSCRLTRVVEAALRQQRDGVVEIRVLGDEHRRGAAVLERATRPRRDLRAQHPSDGGAADETQERDAAIGRERLRDVAVRGDDDLAP